MKTYFRLFGASLALASFLFAADFWEKKKFPDWSAKDAQKMLKESPWARPVEVGGGGGVGSGGGRGGGRRSGPVPGAPGVPDSGGAGGGSDEAGGLSSSAPSGIMATVRWQSALPVRQALAKLKFGDEVGTSPEAAKMLAGSERFYIVSLINAPRAPGTEATIEVYGKEPIHSVDVKTGREGSSSALYFVFPRNPIALEDKEVEVIFKLGSMNIRRKFRLKDMVYEGNLEL